MTTSAESVENEVLALPEEDRARIVLHLLESIENRPAADPKRVEQAWVVESERRYAAYLRGEEPAISAEEVFTELRAEDD